jgi:hypothetical protein
MRTLLAVIVFTSLGLATRPAAACQLRSPEVFQMFRDADTIVVGETTTDPAEGRPMALEVDGTLKGAPPATTLLPLGAVHDCSPVYGPKGSRLIAFATSKHPHVRVVTWTRDLEGALRMFGAARTKRARTRILRRLSRHADPELAAQAKAELRR